MIARALSRVLVASKASGGLRWVLVTRVDATPVTASGDVAYRGSIAARFGALALIPLLVMVLGAWLGLTKDPDIIAVRCDPARAECVIAPDAPSSRTVVRFDEVDGIEVTPAPGGRDAWVIGFETKTRGVVALHQAVRDRQRVEVETLLRETVIERRRSEAVALVLDVKKSSPEVALVTVVFGLGLLALMAWSSSIWITLHVVPSSPEVVCERRGLLRKKTRRLVAGDIEVVRRLPIARGWEVIAFVMRHGGIVEVTQGMPRAEGEALAARIAAALPNAKTDAVRRATVG